MDIKVSGRKTTVTDALRAHVDEKIGEALMVFDIEPMTVDVVLRYEKNPSNPNPAIVEVTVRARGSVDSRCRAWRRYVRRHRISPPIRSPASCASSRTKVVDNRQGGASAADVARSSAPRIGWPTSLPYEEDDDLLIRGRSSIPR